MNTAEVNVNAPTNIDNSLIDKIKENLRGLPGNSMEAENFTIFRVPAHIRKKKLKKELYESQMVSIGPYYHGNDALQAMEKHKWRYLRDFLSRSTMSSIELCISELRGLESRARRCYFEEVKLQSDRFLLMMLLDGCFIIELLIKFYGGGSDTIFDVGWCLPIIRSDLLLLENQIPFFVIQKLFSLLTCSSYPGVAEEDTISVISPISQIPPLVEMLIVYLLEGEKAHRRPATVFIEIKHILHLYHLCYVSSPTPKRPSSARKFIIHGWINPLKIVLVFLAFFLKLGCRRTQISTNREAPETIPSATELNAAGIKFKCKKSENFLDISFQNGTLEIPFISIEETRRCRLLNLLSFEQCFISKLSMDLTSYAGFMSCLFQTTSDVTLLQEKGIVENLLATSEELVSFFDCLTENSYLDFNKHYLQQLFIDVHQYYISDWHRWRATLKRDYFANPWSIISFAAAFFLLVLTVLQTQYTILSYYHS